MDDTMWFKRKPGDVASVGQDEPCVLLGGDVPDWVRVPPELGGQQVRVQCSIHAKCPVCKADAQLHMELEGLLGVCECKPCGKFHWYRRIKK